jgi:large subunit ribosomal protein L13
MDMNKAFFLRKEDCAPKWHVIDATDQVLGRLATNVADLLRGKLKADYTPHAAGGDYVVVTNCTKIVLTGNKLEDKVYTRYSGWRGGLKERTAKELLVKDPTAMIKFAVKGMLPKNKLSRRIIKNLKVYVGTEHPHTAQV